MFNLGSSHRLIPTAVTLDPFDISLYATTEGLRSLQTRFSMYLRGVAYPTRFIAFRHPPISRSALAMSDNGRAARAMPNSKPCCTNIAASTRGIYRIRQKWDMKIMGGRLGHIECQPMQERAAQSETSHADAKDPPY